MEKIDFVITWVDGSDPKWIQKKEQYRDEGISEKRASQRKANTRYRDWGLLPYWFRGIEQYAPWVHHIFLVTDRQIPKWLNTAHPKISVIDHTEFIPEQYLPTFNSHTIELNLYRIPGLAEQYVYFNDDMFLMKMCKAEDFFRKGRPVDEAALNGINGMDEEFAAIQFNNISLMNQYYSTLDCRKHLGKWLFPGYKGHILRTLLLLPFHRLQGIYNPHGPMPILKSTCETVWKRDFSTLDETCRCRFRNRQNVSPYIFRYEQLLSGNFIPHRQKQHFCTVADSAQSIAQYMDRYQMICINDTDMSDKQFEVKKQKLQDIMQSKFPQKSDFEQ